jgi:hypothetical protein
LVAGVGIHCQPLKGQYLRLRKQVDGLVFTKVGKQLVVKTAGVVGPGRNHQDRSVLTAPQRRQESGAGPLADGDSRSITRFFRWFARGVNVPPVLGMAVQ